MIFNNADLEIPFHGRLFLTFKKSIVWDKENILAEKLVYEKNRLAKDSKGRQIDRTVSRKSIIPREINE